MKKKTFDCVQMKHDIQQRILKEMSRVGEREYQKLTEKRLLADPILGSFFKSRIERRDKLTGEKSAKTGKR